MSKTKFLDKIKEIALILKSIQSIVLFAWIVVSSLIQIYPYLFQQWVVEVMRVITPISLAILISYVITVRTKNSIYRELTRISRFYSLQDLIIFLITGSWLEPRGEIKDLEVLVQRIKELDETYVSARLLIIGIPPPNFLGMVISLAKKWDIPFEKLCSFLDNQLGKERLKRLVNPSHILDEYGKGCLSTWNDLTKS